MTPYIVLARNNDGCWIEGPTVEATSAEAAIRAEVGDGKAGAKTYVAVPARSWKPVAVSVETTKRVKLGAVSEPLAAVEPEPVPA
jgi:hypothetical protein